MENVVIINNPFVQDALGYLRDKKTDIQLFRYHSERLCNILMSSVLETENVAQISVQTPLAETQVEKITDDFIIVVILRAGVAMLHSALQLLPEAKVGFAGLARDEKTAIAHEYYWKMPLISPASTIIIPDPMLATGGSVLHVLRKLTAEKLKEIRVVSIVAAPEGVKAIHDEFPNVKIFTAALDSHLDPKKYIVPGLGDFGDRYFGTLIGSDTKKSS